MTRPALWILMCALFCKACSLTCYQCIPETSLNCTETRVECPVGLCGIMKTTSYLGSSQWADMIMKNCSDPEECSTASVNFGVTKTVINNQCCDKDLCNSQTGLELPKSVPNGMKCYTCSGGSCWSTLACVNGEDQCIKATVGAKGQVMKGCATKSFCRGELSTQIGQLSVTVGLTCCKGNLCNDAGVSTLSHLLHTVLPIYWILPTQV